MILAGHRSRYVVVISSVLYLQVLCVEDIEPPIVNTQTVVYLFESDLCDANYVGYTTRQLHQSVSEHRYSAIYSIGRHLSPTHGLDKSKLIDHLFQVFKKCTSKFDCLTNEMLFIKNIKPPLTLTLTRFAPNFSFDPCYSNISY